MFIDYYAILEIAEGAMPEEIKSAFRRQAVKWHPDKHPGRDTTVQMQHINEAYLILKDAEARKKFDAEYQRFKAYKQQQQQKAEQAHAQQEQYRQQQQRQQHTTAQQQTKREYKEKQAEYTDYNVHDDTLNNWMNNARKQSVSLARQTIDDLKGMMAVGFKEGVKGTANAFMLQIIISIIILLIIGLSRSCNT